MANNAGRLFKNPKFTEGSKLPRYIGECEVDGTKKTVAAWIRNPKNGKPYMYINFGEFKPPVKEKTIPIKSKIIILFHTNNFYKFIAKRWNIF